MKGTLDLLVLKTLELEPRHGVGVADRIQQISGGTFVRQARARCSRRSTGWSRRATSRGSGARRPRGAAPSTTASPPPASAS